MPTINLKNISIDEWITIKGETYFLIKDNDQNQNYFCFQNQVKEGWEDLINSREQIKEIEIEYIKNEKGNKVVSICIPQEGEVIL